LNKKEVKVLNMNGFERLFKRELTGWKIYIDTCSLYKSVEKDNESFWDNFEKLLKKNDLKFSIIDAVFREIKYHRHGNKKDERLKETEQKLENQLSKHNKGGTGLMLIVEATEHAVKEHADKAIIKKIAERVDKFNQIYITNDLDNAVQVRRIGKENAKTTGRVSGLSTDKSVHIDELMQKDNYKKIEVYKIDKGNLVSYLPESELKKFIVCSKCSKKYSLKYLAYEEMVKSKKMKKVKNEITCKPCVTGENYSESELYANKVKKSPEKNTKNATKKENLPKVNLNIKVCSKEEFIAPKEGDKVSVVDKDGKRPQITMGKKLASGGEGIVYN
jgi:hypothetical protein